MKGGIILTFRVQMQELTLIAPAINFRWGGGRRTTQPVDRCRFALTVSGSCDFETREHVAIDKPGEYPASQGVHVGDGYTDSNDIQPQSGT